MENMKLNNNLECPMLGLGTFMLSPEDAYTSTLEALKMGYSLIDTANAYVNERAVGRAIKDSGIDRKNIFQYVPQYLHSNEIFDQEWLKL